MSDAIEQVDNLSTEVNAEDNGKKVISVSLTKKGREGLIDLMQESIGFIEEELHEQILNDIENWMNVNYNDLIVFYVQALSKGLVSASQLHEVVEENNALREKLGIEPRAEEELKETIQPTEEIEETPPEPPPSDEVHKPIDEMNGWELRALAKKLGLELSKGMTKPMVYELVRDEIKAKAQ